MAAAPSGGRVISRAEVLKHNKPGDLWLIIAGKVYDSSKFATEHPGGDEVLLQHSGADATGAFEEIGHSQDARKLLPTFYIGEAEPAVTVQPVSLELTQTTRNGVLYRLDPLTQSQSRINPARARRPKPAEADDWMKSLTEIVARTADTCVFCPARILEKVPRFVAPIVSEQDGRFAEGEAIVFPNLNPFGEGHAVAVISQAHFLSMQQYTPSLLKNSFLACLRCFAATHRAHPTLVHPTLVWNYLPPSAGSILHPHLQLLLESEPLPELVRMQERAVAFQKATGKPYLAALVAAEQAHKERFIGSVGRVSVLASFAPRALNEVQLIVAPGAASNLLHLHSDPALLDDLVGALARLLPAYFSQLGVGSFNLVSYSAPLSSAADHPLGLHFRLIARPAPRSLYTSDSGPMERMYDAWVVDSVPEKVAEALQPAFA